MKKRLAVILATAMVLTMAGCGGQGDSGNADDAKKPDTSAEESGDEGEADFGAECGASRFPGAGSGGIRRQLPTGSRQEMYR